MATNADELITGEQAASAAGGTDPFEKHFEMAGAGKDTLADDKTEEQNVQDTEAKSGEGADGTTDKQPDASKDAGKSSGKDGKSERGADDKGKKEEGKASNPGDLTLTDGSVVKAGKERRFYEEAKIGRERLADANNQLKQMTESRDRAREEHRQLRETVQSVNGADPQLVAVGVRMARDLQRDPVGTLRNLLAEAAAAGYTIEGIGAGVDTQAITRIIEQKFEANNATRVDPTEQINNDVAQEINAFYSERPDARIHDELIARVLNDHPQLSLKDAYYELRNSFAQRGLDWSKPLAPQIAPSVQNDNPANSKALPNGRPAVNPKPANKTVVAHESTDTGDIIKEAMREAGLNI